jgi:hypothetical protein
MRTGTVVLDRGFYHRAEIIVVLLADVHVSGVDPVLGKGPGAVGILPQKQMAVVMKVADDRNAEPNL